jgi:hypothetical protein
MNLKRLAITAAAVGALHSSAGFAAITGVTGAMTPLGQLLPGTDLRQNAFQSDTQIAVFNEFQGALSAPVLVDAEGSAFTSPGVIPAGTLVDTYLLHDDPLGTSPTMLGGTISFNEPIIGVEVLSDTLNLSDPILGVPGVLYDTGGTDRGLELGGGGDSYSISGDSFTFTGNFSTSTYMDEVRIICAPVPEPSTVISGALVLLPFGASALRKLRKDRAA